MLFSILPGDNINLLQKLPVACEFENDSKITYEADICFVFLQATGEVHTVADSALWDKLHHIRFYSGKHKNRAEAGLRPDSRVVSGIPLDVIMLTSCKMSVDASDGKFSRAYCRTVVQMTSLFNDVL